MIARSEWLEQRKTGIGGSDVAAVMGLSQWNTPFDVWQKKTGRVPVEDEQTEAQHFGHVLEQTVADEFSRRTGHKVTNRNKMYRADECLIANIDRKIVGMGSVLECKTANAFTSHMWGSDETDEIPDYYLTQVQHYMYVTGYREIAYLAVLIGGSDFRIYPIRYNPDLAEYLAEKCINFWENHVKKDIPPEPINTDDLTAMYKVTKGTSITANERILEACNDLAEIKAQSKELDAHKKNVEFEIKNYLAGNEILLAPNGAKLATWKESVSKRLNTPALKKELPEVAETYSNEITSRRFLLKV